MQTIAIPATNTSGAVIEYRGGWSQIYFHGTWDSATVTLELAYPGGSDWFTAKDIFGDNVAPTSTDGDSYFDIALPAKTQLRATVSGGGGSVALTGKISYGHASVRERHA